MNPNQDQPQTPPETTPQQPPMDPTFTQQPEQVATVAPIGPAGEDPGQTLAIVSIVMDVIGLALIGIILGIMSKKKSIEAGFSGQLGKVGIFLGVLFLAMSILIFGSMIIVAYNGIQDRGRTASVASAANTVVKKAKAYNINANTYPSNLADFSKYPESTLDGIDVTDEKTTDSNEQIRYVFCEKDSAQVIYYNAFIDQPKILALGSASTTAPCDL